MVVERQNPATAGAGPDLSGRIALVTGAASGIGKAIAIALAGAGASVAICDRAEDGLSVTEDDIRSRGGVVLTAPADVSERKDVDQMAALVESEFGPVDLLVNNAGVHGPFGPFADIDPDEWWRTMEVNLRGYVYCMRAILPGMISRGHGRILNMASGTALQAEPLLSSYCVSKTAIVRLSETVAAETRELGVQVFAIEPGGFVRTPMTEDVVAAPVLADKFGKAFDEHRDVPVGLAAELVVRLAAGEADILSGLHIGHPDDLELMVPRAQEIRDRELYVLRQQGDTFCT